MILFNKSIDLNNWVQIKRKKRLKIGFVPTMGALHEGHMSLISQAKQENDLVICSIFVNPTQFNEQDDYNKYPISIEKDKDLLFQENCDVVYIPSVNDIYPVSKDYNLTIDLGEIGYVLEGKHRPGHFNGVMQVVKRLLEIVEPNTLYLGKKDYQQYFILKTMVAHYNMPVHVAQCPIVREESGLAMSSRNRRLTDDEYEAGLLLSQALYEIKKQYKNQQPNELVDYHVAALNRHELISVDYLSIINADNLQEIENWKEASSSICCVAANVGAIRLIDNMTIY